MPTTKTRRRSSTTGDTKRIKGVLVEWEDASGVGGWGHDEDLVKSVKGNKINVVHIGFLMHDGRHGLVLTNGIGPAAVAGLFRIPRGMVKGITQLGTIPLPPGLKEAFEQLEEKKGDWK